MLSSAQFFSTARAKKWLALFTPKLVTCLREGYTWARLGKDTISGLTVAIIALPLSMGIAIGSGAAPECGLFTAIIAGFIISGFGGSRFQIGGPTAAFIIVVARILEHHGYEGLLLATFVAGWILLIAGLLRLGTVIKYIPYPVTIGFTAGIGITILVGQLVDLLGLKTGTLPSAFVPKVSAIMNALPHWDSSVALLSLGIFVVLAVVHWKRPNWPHFLIAVVVAALAVLAFGIDAPTVGSKFGHIANMLPSPHLPDFRLPRIVAILPDAITIALLAGIESLLSAVVADGMTGRRHRSNAELVAQGLANIASPLFGGLPATGAIARTAANIRAGATSPVSGIMHAVFLFIIVLVAAPLIAYVPLAALAVILAVVAWNMSEVNVIGYFLSHASWGDRAVMLSTLLLTVFYDLTVGIEVGVVLAAVKFMHDMASLVEVETNDELIEGDQPDIIRPPRPLFDVPDLPKNVVVYRIHGPFFFGAASELTKVSSRGGVPPRLFILDFQDVPLLDSTGAASLKGMIENMTRKGTRVVLTAVRDAVARDLNRYGVEGKALHFTTASSVAEAVKIG
jgi:SulP family sulfate permease